MSKICVTPLVKQLRWTEVLGEYEETKRSGRQKIMNISYVLRIDCVSLNSSFDNSFVADLIFLGIIIIHYLEESVKA